MCWQKLLPTSRHNATGGFSPPFFVQKNKTNFKNRFLIDSHNETPKKIQPINLKVDYPDIYEYLKNVDDANSGKVRNRTDKGHHWTNLRNCAFLELFSKNKIGWALTSDKWGFTLDKEKYFLTSGGFFLVSENISLKYILASLNSNLMEYYFKFIGVMTAGWCLYI